MEHDLVILVQLALIVPKRNGQVELLVETFHIVFPMMKKGERQSLGSIGVGSNSILDKRKPKLSKLERVFGDEARQIEREAAKMAEGGKKKKRG